MNSEWRFVYKVENESAINVLRTRLPDALRLSGLQNLLKILLL
ncbi:hypothetical protein SB359474_4462 [Shigella boydii 3594-74]|uniref:Uncharacterized protein n=2 Tax=Shigella TaxID=620 RepID=A0A6N3QPZ0_SHIFL|nr:hypothetical protein SGF_02306 [Shigella flexneri CDC 796-83]EGI93688.1 hypothetical protein SB359474_4462 [Shigella boydii 3594-74]EIQ31209.1 hypothetical protein SB444474_4555 [Shigella boydii 4444-74]EJZ62307.1 hypothetical protein SF148580_4147 [Shigella flexneri 1485-80]